MQKSQETIKIPSSPIFIKGEIKVALVHDFLIYPGGAERVLEVLCEMFPEAPIYTLLYDSEKMRGKFKGKDIRTSFLQKFPKFLRQRHQWLLPLMPTAPETFDLREFDLVISSSGAWSKGIVTRLNTIHIAYLHSPMRFVWERHDGYSEKSRWFPVRLLLSYLRIWDRQAADRPDYLIANSKYTEERIRKYYRRESEVIYPPVESSPFVKGGPEGDFCKSGSDKDPSLALPLKKGENLGNYFLIVSRLSPYKKIDAVVEAFNKLELPLVVIGEGKQEKYLRKIAGKNVKILGWQSDEKLEEYYANARAFVFPTVDDFGIAPVEAMNFGVPVIAICQGGVKEIVIEGVTGEFFDAATPEVIADGVRRLMENEKNYKREDIIKRADEFGKERFKRELGEYINNVISKSKIQMSNQKQNLNF